MGDLPATPRAEFVGKRLLGRYVVGDKLAEGGMGAVYRARDDALDGKAVVVKVPHARFLAEAGFRERFEREMRDLLLLEHPHVVRILAKGDEGGVPFFVLPFLAGGSLRERLRAAGGRQTPQEVAAWLPTVARALDAIHAKGVIHRDVKPTNVLFDERGNVFVSDFGIAKALGALDTGLTRIGATPGSPDDRAPEVSLGTAIGPAADQYALAVVVYEALAGRLPHDATDAPARIRDPKAAPAPRPLRDVAAHVAEPVAAAVMRALDRDAARRFASCADFAAAFVAGGTVRAAAAPPDAAIRPATRRAPLRASKVGNDVAASHRAAPRARTARTARPRRTGRRRALLAGALAGLCALIAWRAGWFSGTRAPSAGDGHETAQGPTPPPAAAATPNGLGAKPAWAKTSPAQDAYAAQAGMPVWHETDLGGGETLRFVLVPPGTFSMGSPATEVGRYDDEAPHEVTLTRGYYVSIGEVTNGQYRRWKGGHDSGANFNGATQPVVQVSHEDATGYAAWLSARDGGQTYRLPTEAEWEYACRAGTTTPFWFGATITPEQANYDGNLTYDKGRKGVSRAQTTPLGTFAPNGWGLYDLHGNVWEWCADWYGTYPAGRVQDPPGPSTGSDRVLRGGSWGDDPDYVRSASRLRNTPGVRNGDDGFRLVLVAPTSEAPAAMGEPPAAPPTAPSAKPSWAKTSPAQDAYAAQAGLPVWRETDLGGGQTLRFVLVPPGTFTMGSPTTEEWHQDDERPHDVTLTRGYYVGIGEVTNGQYRRWKGDHDSGTKFNGEAQPAVNVSHADATGFAAWLSAQDRGRTYRLPTEAEWEYACRAGTTTPFWFGATITPEHANYDGRFTYGAGSKGASRRQTTPLGTFLANGWGLYDLHGNVSEWCADWYGAYPAGRVQDPPGPSAGSDRVLRGGSWSFNPGNVRSAQRLKVTPEYRSAHEGFRVVLGSPL